MAIRYYCRHCSVHMGTLEQSVLSSEQLGFDHLDPNERQALITYDKHGDIIVKSICEDCQETLERHPEYHEYDNFIQ